jgi:soluble lytic murein transglycosylase-like protein
MMIIGGLIIVSPAHSQVAPAPASDKPLRQQDNGFRVVETSQGFRLVEHGIWLHRHVIASQERQFLGAHQAGYVQRELRQKSEAPSGLRRASYLPHVQAAESRYALPTGLLDALVWTESRYNPLAISKAGAVGLGQLMPGTARELGISNRFDPIPNIFGAARYLRQMLDKFGVVHLAIAAYNAGPGAVERVGGVPRNGETPDYVRNVLRHWRF